MNSFFDAELFRSRLSETIYWCNQNLGISEDAKKIRSLGNPPVNMFDIFLNKEILYNFSEQIFRERHMKILSNHENLSPDQTITLAGGEILVFFVDEAVACDGVAELYSKGYFDFNAFPAWDCWIYYVTKDNMIKNGIENANNHLLAWIPPQFLEYAKEAIDFNADYSLKMLEDAQKSMKYLEVVNDLIE